MARDLGNGIEIAEDWSEDSLGGFTSGSQAGAPVRVRVVETDAVGLRRLRRERSVLIGLSSRYVLPWRDIVVVETLPDAPAEVAFIEDLPTGPTLAQELDNGLRLTAAQAARLGADLALGLVALHAAGLVHGGIGVDLVRRDGEPSRGQTLPSGRLGGVGVRTLAPGDPPTVAADLVGLAGVVRSVLGDTESDEQLLALLAELADENSGRTARDAATRLATSSNRLSTTAARPSAAAAVAPVAPAPVEPVPEPVVGPTPVVEPEPVVEPTPVVEPEPEPEPVVEPEPEPARFDGEVTDPTLSVLSSDLVEPAEPFVAEETATAAPPPYVEKEPEPPTAELSPPPVDADIGWLLDNSADTTGDVPDEHQDDTPAAEAQTGQPVVPPVAGPPVSHRAPAEMLPVDSRRGTRRAAIIAVVIVVIAALIAVILAAGHSGGGGGSKALVQSSVTPAPVTEPSPVLTQDLSGDTITASSIGRAARPLDGVSSSLDFNSLLMALYAYCDYYTPAASTKTGHSFVGYSSGVGINIYEDVATYTGTSAKDLILGIQHSLGQCPVLMAKDDAGNVLGTFRVAPAGPLAQLPAGQVGLLYERTDMIAPAVQAVFIQQGNYVVVVLAQGRNSADLGGPLDRAAIKALAKIPKS